MEVGEESHAGRAFSVTASPPVAMDAVSLGLIGFSKGRARYLLPLTFCASERSDYPACFVSVATASRSSEI